MCFYVQRKYYLREGGTAINRDVGTLLKQTLNPKSEKKKKKKKKKKNQ